jgi:mannose/fructose/N-acetylgalactosamine-specific phosphotransferase system component IIC
MAFVDQHVILVVVGAAVAGAFIGLDRTAVGQFMISQPIVAAPLAGWMLGDATTGLLIGTTLELVWLLDMPVGAFVPADSTVASVVATAAAIGGSSGTVQLATIGFSLLLSLVLAPVTMMADQVARQFNARLAQEALAASGAGLRRTLVRAQLCGAGVFFLKSLAVYLIFIPLGILGVRVFLGMPDAPHRAMTLFMKLLPLVGAALAVRRLSIRAVDVSLATGFVVAALMGQLFQASALAVMPLALAGGWLGGKYLEKWS